MKLPYIKLYTADLLAASRNLTAQQIGLAVLGICEQAFENDTGYEPQNAHERVLFELLMQWKEEAWASVQEKKKAGRKGGQRTQQKKREIDESTACLGALSTLPKHTETDIETDTETKTETKNTPIPPMPQAAQGESVCVGKETENNPPLGKPSPNNSPLVAFAGQVLAHFEQHVQTDIQKAIWLRKNRRYLRDILNFCGADTTLALRTIRVCILRLKQAGLTGGYGAVCRHLPDYCAQAQQELREQGYQPQAQQKPEAGYGYIQ